MLLTSRDIVNKTFTQIGSRGYDAEEVDNFLDELIVTLDNYSKKVTAMSANLDRAEREVESLKKQVEEHASAAAEASELVERARLEARSLLSEAKTKADSLLSDTAEQCAQLSEKATAEAETMVKEANEQAELIVRKAVERAARLAPAAVEAKQPEAQPAGAGAKAEEAAAAQEQDALPEDEAEGEYPSTEWLEDPDSRYEEVWHAEEKEYES